MNWSEYIVKAHTEVLREYRSSCSRMLAVASGPPRAQTMTEYALILAAVAIVAYVTYQVMGQDIGSNG